MMLIDGLFSETVTALPLKKIVSANIVKRFWNASFKLVDILKDSEWDFELTDSDWEFHLTDHRERIIRISKSFIEENKLPSVFSIYLKDATFLLYESYLRMLWWIQIYDLKDKICDIPKLCDLDIKNYFTVYGEFKEILFVKRFVNNIKNNLCHRFYLSCLYCFENESEEIWKELKKIDLTPYEEILDETLVKLRINILENIDLDLIQIEGFQGNIFKFRLQEYVHKGYGYATYYFLKNLNEAQRISIINDDEYLELLDCEEFYGQQITLILYSYLSSDRKQDLFNWMVEYGADDICTNLTCFWHIESIRSELIHSTYKLPKRMYIEVIKSIANRIELRKLPSDVEIFTILWKNLPLNSKIPLKNKIKIIEGLVREKSFYTLEQVIRSLTLKQKKEYLLDGCHGMNCIDILCKEKEFGLLQQYFSFFLMKFDPVTETQSLLKDARSLLHKLLNSTNFHILCRQELSHTEVIKVKNIIKTLKISIGLLDELCNKVC